jgi:hypothetical protein
VHLGLLVEESRRRYPGPQARDQFVFIGDDGLMPPDDRDLLRYEFRPVLKTAEALLSGFRLASLSPAECHMASASRRRHSIRGPASGWAYGSLDMTYLYTLADTERERRQVQAMFDKLMEVPAGKPQ